MCLGFEASVYFRDDFLTLSCVNGSPKNCLVPTIPIASLIREEKKFELAIRTGLIHFSDIFKAERSMKSRVCLFLLSNRAPRSTIYQSKCLIQQSSKVVLIWELAPTRIFKLFPDNIGNFEILFSHGFCHNTYMGYWISFNNFLITSFLQNLNF